MAIIGVDNAPINKRAFLLTGVTLIALDNFILRFYLVDFILKFQQGYNASQTIVHGTSAPYFS